MDPIKIPISRADSARCAVQHFGFWSIEPKWFSSAVDSIRNGTLKPMAFDDNDFGDDEDDGDQTPDYTIRNGVAIICMDGQMTKRGSSFGGCSTVMTRQAVRDAVNDRAVNAIMLKVSSPGGTCAGTSDLAQDVAAASKQKPVYCYVEDFSCSAAYWVSSQCDYIYANDTAIVGSIGTMILLRDSTGAQEQLGIKYEVVATGEYKGLGADGAVTDKLRADVQREANELNAPFLAGVQAGRKKIKDISAVADGRAHVAAQALTLGLIDEIAPFDAAMAAITKEVQDMTLEEFNAFASANPTATQKFRDEGHAAGKAVGLTEGAQVERDRFKALNDKFGGKRPTFAIEQFAKGNDVAQASVELSDVLMAENEKLQQQIATGKTQTQTAPERPTQQPIPEEHRQEVKPGSQSETTIKDEAKSVVDREKKRRGLK